VTTHTSIFDLSTDKLDYAPGDFALFTVTGVTIGGAVEFQVLHVTDPGADGVFGTPDDTLDAGPDGVTGTADDGYGTTGAGHDPFVVTDGGAGDLDGVANGTIQTEWYVNPDDSLNETFLLSAAEVQAGPDGVFGSVDVNLLDAANPLGLDRRDPFGKDDVTTINQLHLPVNRPVTVLLSSKDVIHSFFLPVMRVKQDSVPGMEIPVRFVPVATTPEEAQLPGCAANLSCWEIACAQLCGLGHYRMRGFFQVHSQADFDSWMDQQLKKLAPATS